MAWQAIDQAEVQADAQLASHLGKTIASNVRAAQQARLRSCTASWDQRYPPLLTALPTGGGQERVGIPLLWYKTARATSLRLRVRHDVQVASLTLGAAVVPWSGYRLALPPIEDSVTCGSTGAQTTELDLDVSAYHPDQLLVVWLIALDASEVTASDEELTDGGSGTGLSGWNTRALECDWAGGSTATHWSASGDFVDEIVPYRIDIVSGATAATATWDQSRTPRVLPAPRFALRFVKDHGGQDVIYVWPPLENGDPTPWLLTTTDWVRRTPVAYTHLLGLELVETAASELPAIGTAYDPGSPASFLSGQRLYAEGEQVFRDHTSVHAVHPGAWQDADADTAFDLVDRLAHAADLSTGGYATIARTVGGEPDRCLSAAGDSLYRVRYEVDALIALTAFGEGTTDLLLRLYLQSYTGSSQLAGSIVAITGVPVNGADRPNAALYRPSPGNWLRHCGNNRVAQTARHTLRGAWPSSLLGDLVLVRVGLSITDDSTSERRALLLTGALGDQVGVPTTPSVQAHLIGWHVAIARTADSDAMGV